MPSWLSNINKPNLCHLCDILKTEIKDFNLKSATDLLTLRNEALEYNQGGIQRIVSSKRVMKRKYRKKLNCVINKGMFSDEDQILNCLKKTNGNIRKTEALLRNHASYIIKVKNQELAAKDKLAPGWIEKVSSSHNKIYYYNTSTGESAWEKPLA